VCALKDAGSLGFKKLSLRVGKDNFNNNTIQTHERFCNKRANMGETVHFPTLRKRAKSVIPNLGSVEHRICSARNRGINERKL
jgi:hypothetical protein